MSAFFDLLDEYHGVSTSVADIQVVTRRLWFYDFVDAPLYLWDGQGKLFTEDDQEWLGSIDADGNNYHITPSIQDGRDGSSANYNFRFKIPDLPGENARELYDALKDEQDKSYNRSLTCYLAIFEAGEGLRPQTPYIFFKELTMKSVRFSEKIERSSDGAMVRNYEATIIARDGNTGRSNKPGGTYADAIQKERAKLLGVAVDKGSEFLASLANRTYTVK